jgi:8-amino-7-oxononanoate synthase
VQQQSAFAEGSLLDFSSNDYLGLSQHPDVVAALNDATRVGSGGSRLLAGAHNAHRLLEEDLASFVGREKALLFSSGYHAALGAIGGLARVVETGFSDQLNHACLIDGLRLTKLTKTIYPHATLPRMGEASKLVLTESLFGMEGDAIDVGAIARSLRPDDVLLIDEAHALGILGEFGGGLAHGIDDPRVVVIGTLSKAFGAHGGFVAGPRPVIEFLQTVARTFIFDTALPPVLADAARIAVRLARTYDTQRAHLLRLAGDLRQRVRAIGFRVPDGLGPIVNMIVGDPRAALELSRQLREAGVNAPAIRPPTVPNGTSRIRITLRATHTESDVDHLVGALRRAL